MKQERIKTNDLKTERFRVQLITDKEKENKLAIMVDVPRTPSDHIFDLLIIGGGVNGCGIARDAAGRGLDVVLVEKDDLAAATSSTSTKLFHGGLRYLEYLKIRLVRESLIEREVLLQAMPHISWPMRFVLPYSPTMRFASNTLVSKILNTTMPWTKGRRPAWIIRMGLFLYDNLGGRKILPATETIDLTTDPVGEPLKDGFVKGYEYSDCWIEDSRLVALNARDAAERGAHILTRTKVTDLIADNQDVWRVQAQDEISKQNINIQARCVINAAGPWVETIMQKSMQKSQYPQESSSDKTPATVRLVKGSHIVTHQLFTHDKSYFLQGNDGRIIFVIPYENKFTLIGTTEEEHKYPDQQPECTEQEIDYLLDFVSTYFKKPVTKDDIVWTYSGVRPLYDSGDSSNNAVTRDYVLVLTQGAQCPPMLNIFGGKITTYRKLAEYALKKIGPFFPDMSPPWTATAPLPGGRWPVDQAQRLTDDLQRAYPFIDADWAKRLVRAYGTDAHNALGDAKKTEDLGQSFGGTLTEREVQWLIDKEFARTAEDVLWRRSKLGLHMHADEQKALQQWFDKERTHIKTKNSRR